jgi:signal transduction histidine kinase
VADQGGIRGRIFVLVSLAALLPLAAAVVVAGSRIARSEASAREQGERLARVLAARVEAMVEAEMVALSALAADPRLDAGDGDDRPERHLLEGRGRSSLLAGLFLAARDGRVLARSAPEAARACDRVIAEASGRPRLAAGAGGAVCLTVPLDVAGRRAMLAGGEVDTAGAAWSALLRPPELDGGFLALVDGHGRVLASGGPAGAAGAHVDEVALPLGDLRMRLFLPRPAASWWGRALEARGVLAALVASGLVLLFAWGAGRSLDAMRKALERRVEDRTRELERLNRELRAREKARGELLRKVITAQEDERKRIARELHDESCQALSLLAIQLDGLSPAVREPVALASLAAARTLAVRTLDDVHRLIFDLRPALLDDLGLNAAIRWLAARQLDPAGIAVRLEIEPVEARLSPEAETALFRAVQETLANVVRHAVASSVLIQVSEADGAVVVDIEDDGVGFDPLAVQEPGISGRGLGLLGIRERMELLGGHACIESAPGQGTRVVLTAPITEVRPPCLASAS